MKENSTDRNAEQSKDKEMDEFEVDKQNFGEGLLHSPKANENSSIDPGSMMASPNPIKEQVVEKKKTRLKVVKTKQRKLIMNVS